MRSIFRDIFLSTAGFFKVPKPGIHILNAHYVTRGFFSVDRDKRIFEGFIRLLLNVGKIISLEEASKMVLAKEIPEKEILIALTFDDGFEECYQVVAPVLSKFNVNAAFFVNANYIESTNEYQKGFNERIATFTKKPMSWQQVTELHKNGHLIGSHSLDHFNMANLSKEKLQIQIVENKRILEDKLNYSCDYFAWPYGQFAHFTDENLLQVLKYHKYVYSGTDYKSYLSYDKKVLNRRQIEPFWPKNHINYFLGVQKS